MAPAGRAQGVAAYLSAVPDLIARGRRPLPEGDPAGEMRALAEAGLAALAEARAIRMPRAARGPLTVMAGVGPVLQAIRRDPDAALRAAPSPADLSLAWRMARVAMTGRF